MHVFADEGGVMWPCCRSVTTKKPNVDAEGRPYRVHEEGGLEAAWNSGYMRRLRLDMLAGGRPAPCERCYMYDDLGMRSHRQDINDVHRARIPALVASTDEAGGAPLDLRSADLRLGNLCNLRCRMCSPQSSKALIGEFAEAWHVPASHHLFDEMRQREWFAGDRFWEIFERHASAVEHLHFAGGEPLIIPQMFDFLARLVAAGRAPDISLSYTTNLSVLPARVYELWPHFKQVRVTASIDGVGPVNAFIRYPSDWPTLDGHLRRLEADAEALNLTGGLSFNTTVQIYNVLRLDELIEYLATTFTRSEAPNLSVLTQPAHFNIRALPAALKDEAASRLRRVMARLEPRWPERWRGAELASLAAGVDGVIEHMMEKDLTKVLPEFRRWTALQDRYRGQHALDVLPELAPILDHDERAPAAAAGAGQNA